MPRYAFEFLERRYPHPLKGASVLLLGVSYRGDVGDTRFSPVEFFYRCLLSAGMLITAHDPYVKYWPETGIQPVTILLEALKAWPVIVVISTGHRIYQQEETVAALLMCNPLWIFDTIGLLSATQIDALRQKHTVIVLGRGDL
jgi:UDP-N-acetyl-D-mannosaminuronate dehydrogenase